MPQRRQQPQPQQIAPQDPYLGDYSALAQQFLRKKDKPIYSVGQGLVEAGSDIAEAFLMKDAAKRESKRAALDNEALAKAFDNTANTGLGIYPEFAGQSPAMSTSQRGRYAVSRLAEQSPELAAENGAYLMQMAKQFEAPKDTYQVSDKFGVMRNPAAGGAPEVVTPLPAPQRAPQLLTPEEEAQQLRIKAAERAPQAPMTPVEMYQKNYGPLAQGMMPEVVDGKVTPRQIPQPSGPQDPAVIEQKRIEALKAELPGAKNKLASVTQPLRALAAKISEAKKDPNTLDVVGPLEGRGLTLNFLGDDNSSASTRIENIRNVAQSIGLNLTRLGGVAPGSITEREWPKFEAVVANLNPNQKEGDFLAELATAEKMAKDLLDGMEADFQNTYAPVLPRVEAPDTRGVSGSWGDGETKVIAGARVTRMGN